jgi:hypothetical protein
MEMLLDDSADAFTPDGAGSEYLSSSSSSGLSWNRSLHPANSSSAVKIAAQGADPGLLLFFVFVFIANLRS